MYKITIKQMNKVYIHVSVLWFISYHLFDIAKYRKYTRLRDFEGVYIIRKKTSVPAVTRKSALEILPTSGMIYFTCAIMYTV